MRDLRHIFFVESVSKHGSLLSESIDNQPGDSKTKSEFAKLAKDLTDAKLEQIRYLQKAADEVAKAAKQVKSDKNEADLKGLKTIASQLLNTAYDGVSSGKEDLDTLSSTTLGKTIDSALKSLKQTLTF